MGKAKRNRRRKPQTETQPTVLSESRCRAGCGHLALERHEGPDGGAVWLCGNCGMRARHSLRQERLSEEITDLLARPFERLAAFREEQRLRIYT